MICWKSKALEAKLKLFPKLDNQTESQLMWKDITDAKSSRTPKRKSYLKQNEFRHSYCVQSQMAYMNTYGLWQDPRCSLKLQGYNFSFS